MPEPMTEQCLKCIAELNGNKTWGHTESAVRHVSELIAEVRRLRELHADALRQIKLIQEKADREIARLGG
jgi:hypothetical protein